jgi:putative ABC transport system ATP-binding protein
MPDAATPALRLAGLGRTVGGVALVADVSLDLGAGEVVAIVGPSGAGKSSLLRLLNRLDEPTAGSVAVHGTDYRSIAPPALRRTVGLVMQRPALFPGTIADNLRYGPRQQGRRLDDATVASLLARVGLAGFGDRDVGFLSGGEAQRVSVARTLANEPEVLLLDEPTSALDAAARSGVEQLLRDVLRAASAGRPVSAVLVTHDVAQAERLAHRVATMAAGRIVGIRPC